MYCPTPHLLDKGNKRSVKHKYLIIHKPSRPVMFSLRCEQLATKFRPDVALKMSTDLSTCSFTMTKTATKPYSTMHLFIGDISDGEEK